MSPSIVSLTHEQTEDVQPDQHLSAGALNRIHGFRGTRDVFGAVFPRCVSGSTVIRQPLLKLRVTVHRIQLLHVVRLIQHLCRIYCPSQPQ